MRKFILGTLLGLVFIAAVGVITFGEAQPITYHMYAEGANGEYKIIDVKTGLVDYVFSENNGTMKSAYLYFAPYGSRVEELVPGTATNMKTLARQYLFSTEWSEFGAVLNGVAEASVSVPSSLHIAFGHKGIALSKTAQIRRIQEKEWKIVDGKISFLIYRVDDTLKVYRASTKTLVRQYMTYLFSTEWSKFGAVLNGVGGKPMSVPSPLHITFGHDGIALSKTAQISRVQEKEWKIVDGKISFLIYRVDKTLEVYRVSTVFPFTVTTNPKNIQPDRYTLATTRVPGPHEFEIEFNGTVGGLKITKQFVLHNDPYYNLDFVLRIDNPTGKPVPLFLVLGGYIRISKGPNLVYEFDGSANPVPLAPGSYASFDGIGLMNKATVFFLKTTGVSGVTPFISFPDNGPEVFGVKFTAPPGKSSYSFPMYTGRRRYLLMEAVGLGSLDNPGTGARTIIPVVQFLEWLYKYTGNYGWAIILFTIITRLVLFPLMRKQYHSMAKMQKIQPKLALIQKRFKDDRQLLQQKMMELYKKEGVNPMGGCLPMLIQLPILILLWKAILYASEAIHFSPGFMWIPDLSLRDPYFILVIVTTGVMMLQQRLMMPMSSGQTTGSQKYMGYLFPVIMAFFFWNFPAGLWLYYLLTTLSQVGQQAFVNWELARAEAETPPATAPELSGEEQGDGITDGDDNRGD